MMNTVNFSNGGSLSQQDTTVAWSRGILSTKNSIKPEPASNSKIRMRSPSLNATNNKSGTPMVAISRNLLGNVGDEMQIYGFI